MPDMNRVFEVELFDQNREVVGVRIQVVAVPWLTRAAVAAAVMGNAAKTAGSQKEHLVFEGVRRERPAVTEDHGLSAAPVLVVDLRAVLGRDCTHGLISRLYPSEAGPRPNRSFRQTGFVTFEIIRWDRIAAVQSVGDSDGEGTLRKARWPCLHRLAAFVTGVARSNGCRPSAARRADVHRKAA